MQANLHLVVAHEVEDFQSFNQSLIYKALLLIVPVFVIPVTSIVIVMTPSLCEIHEHTATSLPKQDNADLRLPTTVYSKPLNLRCRLDTVADVNVMPVIAYKNWFYDYNLSMLGPVQTNLRIYNSINMTVIRSCVFIPQISNFNIQYYRSGRQYAYQMYWYTFTRFVASYRHS